MSDRPRAGGPAGGLARGANFFRGLIGLLRIALFALVFAGVVNAIRKATRLGQLAHDTGASLGSARLVIWLLVADAVLMLVLTIMASYPYRTRLPSRTALTGATVAVAAGVLAVALGYQAHSLLGSAAVGTLLLPLVPFLLSLLLARGAPPTPQRDRRRFGPPGAPGASQTPSSPPPHGRQRRGGRKR